MAATDHDLLRDPVTLQGQWHCSRCGHTIAHKQLREWLLNVPCVPLLPTTLADLFHSGQPVLIGLQAAHGSHKLAYKRGIWWCVACVPWAFFGSAKLEQAYVQAKPRRQRETFWLVWTRGSRRNPTSVAISALLKGASLCGIRTETPGVDPRTVHSGYGVIRRKTLGADPRTAVVAVLLRRDCIGRTTHRERCQL